MIADFTLAVMVESPTTLVVPDLLEAVEELVVPWSLPDEVAPGVLPVAPGVVLEVEEPEEVSEFCAVLPEPIELVPDWLVEGELDVVEPEPEVVDPVLEAVEPEPDVVEPLLEAVEPVSLPELMVLPEGAADVDGVVLVEEPLVDVPVEFWVVSLAAMLLWPLWSLLRLVVVGR